MAGTKLRNWKALSYLLDSLSQKYFITYRKANMILMKRYLIEQFGLSFVDIEDTFRYLFIESNSTFLFNLITI